jgi:hypothetical protein
VVPICGEGRQRHDRPSLVIDEIRADRVHNLFEVAFAVGTSDECGRAADETLTCDVSHKHVALSALDTGGVEDGIADADRGLRYSVS